MSEELLEGVKLLVQGMGIGTACGAIIAGLGFAIFFSFTQYIGAGVETGKYIARRRKKKATDAAANEEGNHK